MATGLWMLYLNPVAFQFKPSKETFVMEGKLVPFVYDNYSNLLEMIEWAKSNDEHCKAIAKKSTEYMKQLQVHKKARSENDIIQTQLAK